MFSSGVVKSSTRISAYKKECQEMKYCRKLSNWWCSSRTIMYRKVRLKHKITTGNARTILEAIFLLFILYWDRKKGDGKSSSTIVVGKSHINFQQVAMEVSICTKMFVSRLSWIQKTKHIFGSTKRSCWNQCWDFLSSYLSTTTTGISGF